MVDLTQRQLLNLWSELVDAYYGKNGFGGNVAEIYAYTILPNNPARNYPEETDFLEKARAEDSAVAGNNLFAVLELFRDRYNCTYKIDGFEVDSPVYFLHRVHVEVIK